MQKIMKSLQIVLKETYRIHKKRLILKTQQRFKSERHIVFTEEINKIALSSNDDKRMQSINLTETNTYETSNVRIQYVRKKIKFNNRVKQYKNN